MGVQILETRMDLGLEQMSSHLFLHPPIAGNPLQTDRKEVKIPCISSQSTLSPCVSPRFAAPHPICVP